MRIKKEIEFNKIVDEILQNEKFIELKYEDHHGISRLDHSLHVARLTFGICKFFRIKKLKSTTYAALLHDFYFTSELSKNKFINHPKYASINAKNVFNINLHQENIIKSHMFPLSRVLPNSKESIIVSISDKLAAIYECVRYKLPFKLSYLLILFINVISTK